MMGENSFQSPARANNITGGLAQSTAASFIPRAYNSASRYSVLGNLNRRNRSVSQHELGADAYGQNQQHQTAVRPTHE